MNLLSIGADVKTIKGEAFGFRTGIVYLTPSNLSGLGNLCPHASASCRQACIYYTGKGAMESVQNARLERTRLFFKSRSLFIQLLDAEIKAAFIKAQLDGFGFAVRLNGTSDIDYQSILLPWGVNIFDANPQVSFYDYTKVAKRCKATLPPNYSLTFSRSESNEREVEEILKTQTNVAVVFADDLPKTWKGRAVIDGDKTDLRFTDEKRVIVGLKAKGKARKDKSGFVV